MKKEEKGITLVALLITIVVLVILAVVAIKEITNNNIILYADSAAHKFKTEEENENTVIHKYDEYLTGTHVCNFNKKRAWDEYKVYEISQKTQDWCTYYYSCSCGKAGTKTFIYHDGITGWPEGRCFHCGVWYDFTNIYENNDEYANTVE